MPVPRLQSPWKPVKLRREGKSAIRAESGGEEASVLMVRVVAVLSCKHKLV